VSSQRYKPGVMVIGLDGLPFTLAQRLIAEGHTPALARLAAEGRLLQMDSVVPTVSAVAWTSFLTGVQPGKHGLYGFVFRGPKRYDIDICSTRIIRRKLLPELVSDAGGEAFSMNVPVTTPPRPVRGVMVGCFLSNSLDTAVWPREEAAYLKSAGYRIDTDAALARKSTAGMLEDVRTTAERRVTAALHYLASRQWDLFHLHVMETDRLNHFLLARGLNGDREFGRAFFECYRYLDSQVARLVEAVADDTPLMIVSDHGFEPIRQEVQLSRWMVERGWTVPKGGPVRSPLDFDPSRTRAYTLIPGQIYVNLRGREPGGIVAPEEYEAVREAVARDLMQLADPATGAAVIRRVRRREEFLWPVGHSGPCPDMDLRERLFGDPVYALAPDLVAEGNPGYDLKMGLAKAALFEKTELEGMHTVDDATLLVRGLDAPAGRPSILDCAPMILGRLGIAAADMDGAAAARQGGG
jgi:predicted AlkP superfamily phosphohydrolase/phosphomutase